MLYLPPPVSVCVYLRCDGLPQHKEEQFHQETENINLETIWWPILQIIILLSAGYVQVLHLKTFFKSRKLI